MEATFKRIAQSLDRGVSYPRRKDSACSTGFKALEEDIGLRAPNFRGVFYLILKGITHEMKVLQAFPVGYGLAN